MAHTPTEGQPFDPAIGPITDPLTNPAKAEAAPVEDPEPEPEDDPKDKGKDEGPAPDEDLDDDDLNEDDGGEDLSKKNIPYTRFKKINEERKQLAQQLAENKLAAEAWNEWKSHPQFFDVMSKVMAAAGQQGQEDTGDIDLSKLNVTEMSDGEIFETAAKLGFGRAKQHYEPKMRMLESRLARLEQGQQTSTDTKFFADKENFPYAERFKADIRAKAIEKGISNEEAYYIVTGPKLVRYGKDLGIKQTLQKGKAPHITGRQTSTAPRSGKIYGSIADAFNEAKNELGM